MSAAATPLACNFTVGDTEIEAMGDLGDFWRGLIPANEPARCHSGRRTYRLMTHPGADPARGERIAIEWLRSLVQHDDTPPLARSAA